MDHLDVVLEKLAIALKDAKRQRLTGTVTVNVENGTAVTISINNVERFVALESDRTKRIERRG